MMDIYGLGLTPEILLGKPTLHVPINLIVQDMGSGKIIGCWQTSDGETLKMGSDKTHQLILGDAFIRPKLVMHSNAFRGAGISSLIRDGFIDTDKWELLFNIEQQ